MRKRYVWILWKKLFLSDKPELVDVFSSYNKMWDAKHELMKKEKSYYFTYEKKLIK
jgi:hypothetical protein